MGENGAKHVVIHTHTNTRRYLKWLNEEEISPKKTENFQNNKRYLISFATFFFDIDSNVSIVVNKKK